MNTENTGYTYMAIDGTENCIAALRDIERGGLHSCFIEMSACFGSCISGPVMEKFHRSPVKDYAAVSRFAGKKDFEVDSPDPLTIKKSFTVIERKLQQPSESEIRDTLRQLLRTLRKSVGSRILTTWSPRTTEALRTLTILSAA